ncbi:hypothetical protein B0I00_0341 [Novosphingobium kunmingense]|uniref:Uncharacterized protein n=1 Tax=Novosphingobium kunmingense TaxID=1211806 RepID=A0A2N0I1V0_9SPHN|nr:hypothetical protein [Novosphingobium kunmingense]PKB25152.1 hypothetical protein B0I00_0341 [Novosphingobium kunmingense]
MDGDRTARAKARIDAALARIEAGVRASKGPADGADLANLQRRHDRLCTVVQQSLDQLDLLIDNAER